MPCELGNEIQRIDMEKHFLADMMEGEPTFKAEPWYNAYGDCVVYKMVDEAIVANRLSDQGSACDLEQVRT